MNISVGIVGMPNVGKSTLFNALTNCSVEAQNYPFCTIEPNKGIVPVVDERLDKIAKIVKTEKIIYPVVEFVDIAGLVKGAAEGAGLGNQFLANIREVAVLAHVVRCFEDGDVIHVEGSVNPKRDLETIDTELILKDLQTLENTSRGLEKSRFEKSAAKQMEFVKELINHLNSGKLANKFANFDEGDIDLINFRKSLNLLTDKPQIYIVNKKTGEESKFKPDNADAQILEIDIKLEYEISQLDEGEKVEYMKEFQIERTGLQQLAAKCFGMLGLISFFTAGEQEARAWVVEKGILIQNAAGAIHTDFTKNFIAADVVNYEDFINSNGWVDLKANGKVRLEGKGYIVKDGDVVIIRHNS